MLFLMRKMTVSNTSRAHYKVAVFDNVNARVLESELPQSCSVDLVQMPESYGKDQQKKLVELMKDFDGAVVRSNTHFLDALDDLPNLRFIGRAGIGVDNINGSLASKNGTIVFYAPDSNTQSVAEMVFFQLGGYLRSPEMQNMLLHQGNSEKEVKKQFKGKELNESTLSIIGVGDIGSKVLPIAQGFGMDILLYDPVKSTEELNQLINTNPRTPIYHAQTLEEALKADYVTVHVPLIEKTEGHEGTRNLIRKKHLKKMKQGSVLINNSRAGIVDENAVLQELKKKTRSLQAYITDVLSGGSPLLGMEDVFVTAHSAANTQDAQHRAAAFIGESIHDYVISQGKKILRSYNYPTIEEELVDPYNLTRIAAAFSTKYITHQNHSLKKVNVLARGVSSYHERALIMAAEAGIAIGLDRLNGRSTDLPAHSIVSDSGILVSSQQVKGAELGFTPRITLEYELSSGKKMCFVGQIEKDGEEWNRYAMKQIDKFGEQGMGRVSLRPTSYVLVNHRNIPAQLAGASEVLGVEYGFNISGDQANLEGSARSRRNMFVFPVTHPTNKVGEQLLTSIEGKLDNAEAIHIDLTGYQHRY